MYTIKKKHYLHCLLAFLAAALIFIPAFLQVRTNAASTPGTVTLSKISAPAYNKITISWKKIGNATAYNIYYRKHGSSKWTKVASVSSSASSYTHTSSTNRPIVVGQKYDYTVRAYNKKSKKMGKYNTSGLTARTLPNKVKLGKAKVNSNNTVSISWSKTKGCNYYLVYRKPAGGKWFKIATVTGLSYTDRQPFIGEESFYTVRGYYSKTKVKGGYDTKGLSVKIDCGKYDDDYDIEDSKDDSDDVKKYSPQQIQQMVQEVFRLTNIERQKEGSPPLTYNKALEKGAMARAKELTVKFAHTRPDGTDSSVAYYKAGAGHTSGENIAVGYDSPESVVQGWMHSPGHRHAMIASWQLYIGVGFYQDNDGNCYWVQGFANGDPDEKATLTFDANGGVFPQSNSSYYKITGPIDMDVDFKEDVPVPVRPGYTFNGWISPYNEKLDSGAIGYARTVFKASWI